MVDLMLGVCGSNFKGCDRGNENTAIFDVWYVYMWVRPAIARNFI